jgi:hypothetical protein
MMENKDSGVFDEVAFRDHLYDELVKLGYAVTAKEACDIARIATDYLIACGMEEID